MVVLVTLNNALDRVWNFYQIKYKLNLIFLFLFQYFKIELEFLLSVSICKAPI